jgi:hypothetical protein
MINAPKESTFKVLFDKKAKNSLIVPGLYLEVQVVFQTDYLDDYQDKVQFITENYVQELQLKAFKPQAIIYYEPIINFGCVVVNSKKLVNVEFINEGVLDVSLEFKLEKVTELALSNDRIDLPKKTNNKEKQKNKATLQVTYE